VVAGCGSTEPNASDGAEATATVERVVDGDTLVVRVDGQRERVRLIGINTPESVARDRPVMCFGKEASAHLQELLPEGTPIRMERDVETRDRFDRLLAYVYRADDGRFVNLAMVTDGYAQQYTFPPNVAHADEFGDAERAARRDGAGLWSACEDPFEE
jgi:micrococcal nuclease